MCGSLGQKTNHVPSLGCVSECKFISHEVYNQECEPKACLWIHLYIF